MSEILVSEIVEGIGESGVRCGLIGEMGCSSPLTENEKRSLKAAAIAQQKTGMATKEKKKKKSQLLTIFYPTIFRCPSNNPSRTE